MKFGTVPVREAQGLILAHSIASLKKGHVLTDADIRALEAAGIASVITANLEHGDVHEDLAATRIAEALKGSNCTLAPAHTGRVNIHATARGLATIDAGMVHRVNTLHESVTLATVNRHELVDARQLVATVKIIPFAAPDWVVDAAAAHAASAPLRVAAFSPKRVALISTILPGMKLSLLEKTRGVLDARLEALGSTIIDEHRVPHDSEAIAEAISLCAKQSPDIIMIMGASATTDREDSVPAGVIAAGGTVEHFGMPVDPGNLLLLADHVDTPVIGIPGCARSPKLNGLDFVLQRLCAGIRVTSADIQAMGVGGLLKEIPTRPQPREQSGSCRRQSKIAAIVLAAGRSTRMGEHNKLLLPMNGKPMIRHTVTSVLSSGVAHVVIVTGHDAEAVRMALDGLSVSFTHNPDFAIGMASSLRAGLAALPADTDAALICLGDMPAVSPDDIRGLMSAFDPDEHRAIIIPTNRGKRGNPVLFARQFFTEMAAGSGDTGARNLLNAYPEAIFEVEMASAAVLADADTPAAFEALQAEFGKAGHT